MIIFLLRQQVQILLLSRVQRSTLGTWRVEHQTKQLMGTQLLQAMLATVPTPIGIHGALRPGGGLIWATHTD